MKQQNIHHIVDLSGAIDEKITPSVAQRVRLISVNLKFSDVLTQDRIFIRHLDRFDNIIEEYGFGPDDDNFDDTATNFTWVPASNTMKIPPHNKIQIAFANNDSRTLTAKQSNINYEFI